MAKATFGVPMVIKRDITTIIGTNVSLLLASNPGLNYQEVTTDQIFFVDRVSPPNLSDIKPKQLVAVLPPPPPFFPSKTSHFFHHRFSLPKQTQE